MNYRRGVLELIILTIIALDNERHADIVVDEAALGLSHQVYLTDEAVDARTHVANHLEER